MEFHRRAVDRFEHHGQRRAVGGTSPASSAGNELQILNPTAGSTSQATTQPAAAVTTTTTTVNPVPTTTTTTTIAPVVTTTTTTAVATTTTTHSVAPIVTTTTTIATTTTTPSQAIIETTTSSTPPHTTTASSVQGKVTTTTSQTGLTTIAYVTAATSTTSSSSSSSATSLANNTSKSSSGPSTGTVIGIVAGALAGVIVLSAIVGYLFRKKWGRGDDDDSPFDRDDFRRGSIMLDDNAYDNRAGMMSGNHSPQMSEYSLNAMGGGGATGLGRAGTVLPGIQRNGTLQSPRPPSSIVNHFHRQQQQQVPSFQPGQVVNMNNYGAPQAHFAGGSGYGGQPGGLDMYGGYPMGGPQQQMLDRGMYGQQPVQQQQGYNQQHPYAMQQNVNGAGLERNPSNASTYSQDGGLAPIVQRSRAPSPGPFGGNQTERLALVQEQQEELDHTAYSRSGTPTNSNVQQFHFSHGRNDSEAGTTILPGYVVESDNVVGRTRSLTARTYGEEKETRAKRTLSVRNGGLDSPNRPQSGMSDIYGGYE